MVRVNQLEILEQSGLPDDLVSRAYRDLARLHRWLGDTRFIVRAIRRDPLPVRRVLDVGCGPGLVAERLSRQLGVEVVGADIRTPPSVCTAVPIVRADARCDRLPQADVAFSMHLGHHLSEGDLAALIRNVGRFCRRFILLDCVRHSLPLALFRVFVAPFLCPIDAEDGQRSIRRSYTPDELRRIAARAMTGAGAVIRTSVAPLYMRQAVDISY